MDRDGEHYGKHLWSLEVTFGGGEKPVGFLESVYSYLSVYLQRSEDVMAELRC